MADDPLDSETGELTPRPPEESDLIALCRELNARGARYVVIGGFAIIVAGLPRTTGDIDLLVDPDLENEARVFDALATLPDGCVRELAPGDVGRYVVVRVADEVVIDLMSEASGVGYAEAAQSVTVLERGDVSIPFANPALLWRMKRRTHRAKDQGDLEFLRRWFASEGRTPPAD